MGQAKVKRRAKAQEILAEILKQNNEPETVQIFIQKKDGWFRGVDANKMSIVRDLWAEHGGDRQLIVYRIDKFWVQQKWKTPKGSFAHRGDIILEVKVNETARDIWFHTVSQPHLIDSFRDQIEVTRNGENGCVMFWWLQRYLLCRASLGLQKLPVNHWEYRPIVEVFHTDGSHEQSAIDLAEFLDQNKILEADPKNVQSPAKWELEVFNACIKEEIIKKKR